MKKPVALAIAGALTALVLVLMFGVGTTVAIQSFLVSRTSAPQQLPLDNVAPKSNTASSSAATTFTAEQAGQIGLAAVPNSKLTAVPELVDLQGTVAYQVTLNSAIVYIDANTGRVLYNSTNANSTPNNDSLRRSRERSESHEEHEEEEEDDD
ncbi:MAG: PepSY domain-containing protein [Chloroflexi bacterium]|nr:PepSY domain-containing protein [Chloroflexota bacterium]